MANFDTRFATAILGDPAILPEGIAAWHSRRPEQRFDVYRNNVAVGLSKALASRFPAAERIVGEAFFAAVARIYALAHPPRSPVLMRYGDDFPDFVETFEPAASVPYLADVMRLEAARGHAYHAADVAPMDAAALARLEPGSLAEARAMLHPAASLLRSAHPVVTIWAMNAGEREIGPIEPWTGETALVVRPLLRVQVLSVPASDTAFLAALFSGHRFGAAFEAASQSPGFDLTASLVRLVGSGALAGIETEEDRGEMR